MTRVFYQGSNRGKTYVLAECSLCAASDGRYVDASSLAYAKAAIVETFERRCKRAGAESPAGECFLDAASVMLG